jgi:hypothetical protein
MKIFAFAVLLLLGALEVLFGLFLSLLVLYHRKIQDLQSYWPVVSLFGFITIIATGIFVVSTLSERKRAVPHNYNIE